ncbi:MAG: DDE-type integrase/transposase/recombinase, partial [Armatimonadetes bacterium]|nr:DDE-type integrase/transposase/recombinase [Armatimonadota bacterium]NIO97087.1 DDE-type integrase/transposase/recombinase [Armatimonadota bacterium]
MEGYIKGLLARNPHIRIVRVYEYTKNKFSSQGIDIPSKETIRKFVTLWKEKHQELYTFLKNPDHWRSEFQLALGDAGAKADYFLHMLEFDSTPADIMCADKRRYTVVGAIDIFSRKAKCLITPVSKSVAIANLMRWIILNWGLFDIMIADNGKDFASRHVEAICGALNIELRPTPPFCPEAKPFIERFFQTLAVGLFEELSGYIGHSAAERKELESRHSFAQRMFHKDELIQCRMMPDELQAAVDSWMEAI